MSFKIDFFLFLQTYASELLPMGSADDPTKPMLTLSNYLMKKRKWPYRGWHKRFFQLQSGYLTYGKSEQEVLIFFDFLRFDFPFCFSSV